MSNVLAIPLIGNIGGWEMFLLILVILLLFGAKRLPDLARGLGKGIREFKDALHGVEKEIKEPPRMVDKDPTKPSGDN